MKNIISKIKKKGVFFSILYFFFSCIYKLSKPLFILIFKFNLINDDMIMFMSRPDYSDNAKQLYEYMKQKNPNYKYIWLTEKKYNNKMENAKFVIFFSKYHNGPTIKALYYASKCKMIFYTHLSPLNNMKPKKKQIIINLWHGCGYKNAEVSNKKYFDCNYFDYALVPGEIFIDKKSIFWGCDKNKIIPIGYPRYDLLFSKNEKAKEYYVKLKKDNSMLIMWMPTFRKTLKGVYPESNIKYNFDLPLFNSVDDLKKIDQLCHKNKIQLCIKRHPMQIHYSCENMHFSNICFISNDDLEHNKVDLYSLLKYSDGLVTDYSSVAIDYLLLNKPIAFVLSDFEEYSKCRGFVFDNPLNYMPGYHIYDLNDLKEFIEKPYDGFDLYKKDRKKIIHELHNPCDNYCKRIIDFIESKENNYDK